MNRSFWKSRLGLQLIADVLISLLVCVGVFFALRWAAFSILDEKTQNTEFWARQEEKCAARFERYVSDNKVALTDRDALDQWVKRERFMMLFLYRDNMLVYASTIPEGEVLPDSTYSSAVSTEDGMYISDAGEDQIYTVQFEDGPAIAEFYCYYDLMYYTLASIACGFLGFIAFLIVFTHLIRRKLNYINFLERELKILEGGDLNYPITIRGRNELSDLARGIDDMRKSIIQRQEGEEKARRANHELITAMSHDLRTPLTSLLGYLDIIELKKYSGEAELTQFVHSSHEKALQIKQLSDKLFEYFLVYGKEEEETETECIDGLEFMQQVLVEAIFDMESRGFQIESDLPEIHCSLDVNVDQIRRVFDNTLSNLAKYADRDWPVHISYTAADHKLKVEFENRENTDSSAVESSGIGVKTCIKIMKLHRGEYRTSRENGIFKTTIVLPCRPVIRPAD
ncbi:HAMP domain-containing sensor histidine kinase [Anaerolentibacter hominis]|uniref:sensor histidine kinase n=1 Tax=Anaerolentibacter hominis TaxID=3079009 RepID=UPI0031B7F012